MVAEGDTDAVEAMRGYVALVVGEGRHRDEQGRGRSFLHGVLEV